MKLRVLCDESFTNLDVIRKVLVQCGKGVVEFSNGKGAGNLKWTKDAKGGTRVVRIAIPLASLTDPAKAREVQASVRYFAESVRLVRNSN